MGKIDKIVKIVKFFNSYCTPPLGINFSSEYDIINSDEKNGVKFKDDQKIYFFEGINDEKLPWDYSIANNIQLFFKHSHLKTLDGIPSSLKYIFLEDVDIVVFPYQLPTTKIVTIKNCYSIKSINGIYENLESLELVNCPKLVEINMHTKKMNIVYLREMYVENISNFNSRFIKIKDNKIPLNFAETPICKKIEIDGCKFSNIDGLTQYTGSIYLRIHEKYAGDFNFKRDGEFVRFKNVIRNFNYME